MAPPPPSPSAGAVCCMCGDQGLPGELFRCRRCHARLQHRYCSDLYPRAAAYRRCNWCLREPPLPDHGGRPGGHATAAVANSSSSPKEKRKTAPAPDEERQQRHEGCSSMRPPAEPGRLVKKKHKTEQRMPPPPPPPPQPQPEEIIVTDASGSKEVMRAGKTRVNRVRVRRYKLLAEVISC